MDRTRIGWLVATLALPATAWSQGPPQQVLAPATVQQAVNLVDMKGAVCSVYGLADLGEDPGVAQWVADTIPKVIQPATWNCGPKAGALSYHAASRVVVVYHVPEVQAQVEAFLKSLKKSMPAGKVETAVGWAKSPSGVKQANFALTEVPSEGPVPLPYPVPNQAKQPKHLFHFIIRYEGEGIIDSNVVELFKSYGDSGGSDTKAPGPLRMGTVSAYSTSPNISAAPGVVTSPGTPTIDVPASSPPPTSFQSTNSQPMSLQPVAAQK